MKNKFLYILLIMINSCTYKEKYFINSPKGDKKLTFEWVNTLDPNKRGYIKIYLTDLADNSISIRPMMDFPIHVYWGDTIKVRGGILVGTNTSSKEIDWKRDYTKLEEGQIMVDTVNWKQYYLTKIPKGYYK